MISIIISTYRNNYLVDLVSNIEDTIGGIPYEIIDIENPAIMSIASAYNLGASKARYDYLIFLHEDVFFHTKDWGKQIAQVLKEKKTGVVGLAGNEKKFRLPTGCETGIKTYRHVYVAHSKKEILQKKAEVKTIPVKTLDGVFLCMTSSRWNEFKFDEDITGFHFYDLDISLRISGKYQNYVLSSISLQHFSLGNFGNEWVKKSLKFNRGDYDFDSCSSKEKEQVRKFWYSRLKNENISFYNRFLYLKKMGIGLNSWRLALKFLYR